ncbi:hypothetical protein ACIGXF_35430 [Streptomyces sp. NPDC053086]|uniref:hypothetical protein n=1 Tax=unclassified Streptomyces TaxID=2593676 RepID=UPI0037D29720
MAEKQIVYLRCNGDGVGDRYLNANPGSDEHPADNPEKVFLGGKTGKGGLWLLTPLGSGNYTIYCLADQDFHDIIFGSNEPRFLDGNTSTGEVKLVYTTDPPFTGTRWHVSVTDDYTTVKCLGAGAAAGSPTWLDGWVDQGSVQLRADEPTGTRWAIEDYVPE